MNKEDIKIVVSFDDCTKTIDITKDGIKIDSKKATFADCIKCFKIADQFKDIFISYARTLLPNEK